MNDMSQVITPKSDQISADTLLAGPMTVTVREVHIRGGQEQPVSIVLEETDLVYRPCKSMSRVLVRAWGPDAKAYTGRSLTLYRDPSVKWAGMEVGGIRISHLSHIDGKMQMQLTATKGQRKPHVVMPLVMQRQERTTAQQQARQTAKEWADEHLDLIDRCAGIENLERVIKDGLRAMGKLATEHAELYHEITHAYQLRREALSVEKRPDDAFGDQYDGGEG